MSWIELAPRHKQGLPIPAPIMPAAGAFGYGEEYRDLVGYTQEDGTPLLGALVTNPVSFKPRHVAKARRMAVHGDSVIVHTGLPNPGLRAVIKQHGQFWARQAMPIIVHLITTTPHDVARACEHLTQVRGVLGVELGLDDHTTVDRAVTFLDAARERGELPIIVRVPFSDVEGLAPALVEAGVDALTLTAPPRALLPTSEGLMRGRLYSPLVFPLLLQCLHYWEERLAVPLIACGGITSGAEARACLDLGAAAVQVDALMWRDPALLERIARNLVDDE